MTSFAALGVIPALTEVLNKQGIKVATPVQEKAIPAIFKGRDVIAKSQTGTGKTLAYLLPFVQRIQTERDEVQALILTPTRELSKQVFDVLKSLASVRGVDAADVTYNRKSDSEAEEKSTCYHWYSGKTAGSYPSPYIESERRKNGYTG